MKLKNIRLKKTVRIPGKGSYEHLPEGVVDGALLVAGDVVVPVADIRVAELDVDTSSRARKP